jgi:hypothetical protein
LFSRLPDDPEYWHKFTDRIVDDAVTELEKLRENRAEWWSEIAQFSTLLAVGASAAVFASFLLMPAGGPVENPTRTMDAYGLAPDDPLAVTLVSGGAAPTLESLLAARNAEFDR